MRVGAVLSTGLMLVAAAWPGTLSAQSCDSEDMAFECPESWGMKFFTSVSLFTGFGAPARGAAGDLEIGLEGGTVPQLSDDERRLGFNGQKLEDTNKSRVFGRVRARYHLTDRVQVEAGFVPPIEVNGATPLLFDLAVAAPIVERGSGRLGIRGYGQIGGVEGDITCDAQTVAAGSDLSRNPFQCEQVSEDEIDQRYVGVELAGAWELAGVEPYASVSMNYMDLGFNVRARYSGNTDRRDLGTRGTTFAVTGGLRAALTDKLGLAAEMFYSPLDIRRPQAAGIANESLFNVRAQVSWQVR